MTFIIASTGAIVTVDEDVAEWLDNKPVCISAGKYPMARRQYLHRLVADTPLGMFTDHKNGNPLDCRRENLRVCSNKENARNCRKKKGANPFKGVFKHHTGKWRAQLMVERKTIHLGLFSQAIDAARAYDAAAKYHFGQYALVNLTSA